MVVHTLKYSPTNECTGSDGRNGGNSPGVSRKPQLLKYVSAERAREIVTAYQSKQFTHTAMQATSTATTHTVKKNYNFEWVLNKLLFWNSLSSSKELVRVPC